jgi:ribA/ribD-fused uncharacterized protein
METTKDLRQFYQGRAKSNILFDYDDEGNLIQRNPKDKSLPIIKTIPLPNYRAPTFEEFDEMEKKRNEDIATATKEYEDARKALRAIYDNPDKTDSEILRLNRAVVEADVKLQNIRFPLKTVELLDSLFISDIDFAQTQEKRKFPYPFYSLKEFPFNLQDYYVRIGKPAETPPISVAEAAAKAAENIPVILFAEPDTNDYGFLSLKWAVELEFNATMYNSAHQAICAEIAKAFNDQDNLQKIMTAESPAEVSYSLDDVPGDGETNETKWNDLTKQLIYDTNIAKFNQYPELANRLLETKNAVLGAYIPDDNLIGIGISLDNIQSKNPINWTGQNILGKALTDIREKIRAEREAAQVAPAPVQRRKKPTVAASTAVAPPAPQPPAVSEQVLTSPSMSAVPAEAVARPIRRRPQPAVPAQQEPAVPEQKEP